MSHPRALYHMVRADFLERVRRYGFLLTLGLSVYLAYAVYVGQIGLQLGRYRGVQNSAWVGSVVGLVASVFLSLVGFYVVKNAIQRDRETRVGQILAATPMSKSFYVLSKVLSNFAVLATMVLILASAAVLIQLLQGEDVHIQFFPLLGPILIFGLCALAVTAALAVLFETLPGLRAGLGNVFYVFIWMALLVLGATRAMTPHYFADYSGVGTVLGQMQALVHQLDPQSHGARMFVGGAGPNASTKTFLWPGVQWNGALLASRLLWLAIATAVAALAITLFDRFDPARAVRTKARHSGPDGGLEGHEGDKLGSVASRQNIVRLTPLAPNATRSRFSALVVAELRLMLRGHAWWWYAVAAGLFVACLAAPLSAARAGIILAVWLWPVLLWSQMGTREAQFLTRPLIYSAPRAFPRQLLAIWAAGICVAVLTGGGLGLPLLLARDFVGLEAWTAAALFIPALALALGVWTESRKPFEALYTVWWYIGPVHHISTLDFMGTTVGSTTPALYLAGSAMLLIAACAWRKVRLSYA
jgi:hypothetical protein